MGLKRKESSWWVSYIWAAEKDGKQGEKENTVVGNREACSASLLGDLEGEIFFWVEDKEIETARWGSRAGSQETLSLRRAFQVWLLGHSFALLDLLFICMLCFGFILGCFLSLLPMSDVLFLPWTWCIKIMILLPFYATCIRPLDLYGMERGVMVFGLLILCSVLVFALLCISMFLLGVFGVISISVGSRLSRGIHGKMFW